MTDYMAAMLDELMGASRNAAPGEKVEIDFEGPDVCKDYLAGFCVHDLFRNTKNDLGFCSLKHDPAVKKTYDESSRRFKMGYEQRFLDKIVDLDREVRRKIEKNERRLTLTQSTSGDDANIAALKEKHEERKNEIAKKIDDKMSEAEMAGESGNVSLAQTLVSEADDLRKEQEQHEEEGRRLLERFHHIEEVANSLNKPMKVCQTCGCFMLVNDAQSRIDDHFAGKLHLSYAKIRETIPELQQAIEDARNKGSGRDRERERERERDRDRRSDKGDREKDDRDKKDREKRRSRSPRDRDRRDERDRRDKDKERDREREREKDRRDRDRGDRERSDKDRDRERDRRRR